MRTEAITSRLQKALWPVMLLSLACGTAWSIYPVPGAAARLREIPLERGIFHGRDINLTEREKIVLGRVDLIHREYAFAGRSAYVTVIDGSKDRHAVHDPRYCFQGAGWKVLEEKRRPVPGGEGTWIAAEREGRKFEAAFWFSNEGRRYSSVGRYLWDTVVRRVTFGRLGGQPLLVVFQSYNDRPIEWSQMETMINELRL